MLSHVLLQLIRLFAGIVALLTGKRFLAGLWKLVILQTIGVTAREVALLTTPVCILCSTHILVTSRGGIGNYSSWIFWPRYEPKKMANLRYEHLDTKYIKWGLTCWYTLQHILCHRNFILGDSFEKSRYFLGLKAKAWGWSKDRVELSSLQGESEVRLPAWALPNHRDHHILQTGWWSLMLRGRRNYECYCLFWSLKQTEAPIQEQMCG